MFTCAARVVTRIEKRVGRKFKPSMFFLLMTLHIITLWAFVHWWHAGFSFWNWMLAGSFLLFSGLGVSLGNHRYITHESFEARKPIGHILMTASALAAAFVRTWSRNHKLHHIYSDDPQKDPHCPEMFKSCLLKIFWPQIGWLMFDYEPHDAPIFAHSRHQELIDWQARWYIPILLTGILIIPYAVAGFDGILLAIVRLTLGIHIMGSVNSFGHMNILWGTPMDKRSESRNNTILAYLFVVGEWWHANHHTHPRSARIGWYWWQLDLGWYILFVLKQFGLVCGIVLPRKLFPSATS